MATVVTTTSIGKQVGTKSGLISRTLQRCKSGLSAGGGSGRSSSPAGCSRCTWALSDQFVVHAECANHPLFRRLLDDAEREYGYAAQGPLALPGCDVDTFLDDAEREYGYEAPLLDEVAPAEPPASPSARATAPAAAPDRARLRHQGPRGLRCRSGRYDWKTKLGEATLCT